MREFYDYEPHRRCNEAEPNDVYGCLYCRKQCKNSAGEASHMFKAHKQIVQRRRLVDSTCCPACLRNYHTMEKVVAQPRLQQDPRMDNDLHLACVDCSMRPPLRRRSPTTWTRTLDFFIDALDEQDVARFEMDLEAVQKQIAELQCLMSWGLVPPGDSAPQTREQLEQECSWMLRSLNGRLMLAFLANLEGIACSPPLCGPATTRRHSVFP